jgi:large subunit ribosomal protein L21
MFSVVAVGGRQYKVAPGDEILVEKLEAEAGSTVKLPVLLVSDDEGVTVGTPMVAGREVSATVMRQEKGKKLTVFRYTPKKRFRKKTGHRQPYTRLKIEGY